MSRRIALCRRVGISDSLENEAWSVKEEDVIRLKTDDAILIRQICTDRSEDGFSAEKPRDKLKLNRMSEQLQGFDHLERLVLKKVLGVVNVKPSRLMVAFPRIQENME